MGYKLNRTKHRLINTNFFPIFQYFHEPKNGKISLSVMLSERLESRYIVQFFGGFAPFAKCSTSCIENTFLVRNRVDAVSSTSLSLHDKEGILTVLHFKRDLKLCQSIFPTYSSSGDKNPGDLKCNKYVVLKKILFSILSCKSGNIASAVYDRIVLNRNRSALFCTLQIV